METKRPTTPAAEEILGGYFPVLDHGFVSLVDYMGNDDSVERAARVSYGYGTRKRSQTRGLVRYLRRHRHTTPSEMVEFKFHCCMPMFVARQWIRHRTACLAPGTEVHFDLPGGIERGGSRLHKLTIEEIWRRFQPAENQTGADARRNPHLRRDRVRAMHLRQVDEETMRIRHTRVVDVYRNGVKPVFRMHLSDGKSIEATADHRFLFADGWSTLKAATGLQRSGDCAVWNDGDYYVRTNGVMREVPPTQQPLGGPAVRADWKKRPPVARNKLEFAELVRVEGFEYVGEVETYDLEVEGPYHNFVANGIVTHNSVNEYSGRYSLMPLLFYKPELEHFALQSAANNQGRQEDPAPEALYQVAIERWERARQEAGDGYTWLISEDVARELARIDLPLSTYTQWYWKIDLHNLLHFLSLRADPHSQLEIRAYADVMAAIVKRVAPLSYEAWVDYDLTGQPFSRVELEALSQLLVGDETGVAARDGAELSDAMLSEMGLSKREIRELKTKLEAPPHPDFELDLATMRSAEDVGREMSEAVPGTFE